MRKADEIRRAKEIHLGSEGTASRFITNSPVCGLLPVPKLGSLPGFLALVPIFNHLPF